MLSETIYICVKWLTRIDAGLILFNTKQLLYTVSTEVIIDCPMKFRWPPYHTYSFLQMLKPKVKCQYMESRASIMSSKVEDWQKGSFIQQEWERVGAKSNGTWTKRWQIFKEAINVQMRIFRTWTKKCHPFFFVNISFASNSTQLVNKRASNVNFCPCFHLRFFLLK